MAGTKSGGLKARETIYHNQGRDFYREIGRKGGQNGHTGGFASNPELAKTAGAKGGKISKRGRNKKMKIELSTEQVNQIIHYDNTKSIATACNLAQSLVDKVLENLAKELM